MEDPQFGATRKMLEDFLYVIFYRKILIVVVFFTMATVLSFLVYLITPRYEATAKILVHQNPSQQLLPFQDLIYPPEASTRVNKGLEIVEITKSREIAEKIVRKFSLDKRYEKKMTHPEDTRGKIKKYILEVLKSPKKIIERMVPAEHSPRNYLASAVDEFLEKTEDIQLIEDTQIVNLTIAEKSPELATKIANEMAKLLIDKVSSLAKMESYTAYEFTKKELAITESQYQKSLEALAKFKEKQNVISLPEEKTLKLRRLEELRGQLTLVQADIDEKTSEYEGVVHDLAKQNQRLHSPSLYDKMKEKELLLRIEISSLKGRKESLSSSIKNLEEELSQLIRLENDLLRLEQRVKIDEDVYLRLKDKLSKLAIQKESDLSEIDLKIVDHAYVAPEAKPDSPDFLILGPVILFLSVSLALSLALFTEYWSDSLKRSSIIETRLGLPLLGIIPKLK